MTDTTNGHRALPWRSEGYRILDADGIEVANTRTPDLASKAVAKDIVDDVNAHYGVDDLLERLESELDAKDARIAELEQEARKVSVDWRSSRIADLERKLKRAHDTMADLHREWAREEARAEAAEADLSYYKTASKNFEDSYWEADERAEEAEARVRALEEKLERATWEYGVLDYDRRMDLAKAGAGSAAFLDDEYDDYPVGTFTAPDGRVFREGQRVWHIWDEPGEFGHITDINGGFPLVQFQFQEADDQTHPGNLRRVWDGSEEPDVELDTVLKDGYDWYLLKSEGGWRPWRPAHRKWSEKVFEWEEVHLEDYAPYVEHLPGDDD